MSLKANDLFGGALSVLLPSNAKDISDLRQIPDNQEVFAHPVTDQSIIIEILEYVDKDDEEAIRTHFSDLASDNDVQSGDAIIAQTEKIPDTDLKMTHKMSPSLTRQPRTQWTCILVCFVFPNLPRTFW